MRMFGKEVFYSMAEVKRIMKIKEGRIRPWIELGYITPDIRAAGTGHTHYFRESSLYTIGLMQGMCNFGFKRYRSSYVAYSLTPKDWKDVSKAEIYYIVIYVNGVPHEKRKWFYREMEIKKFNNKPPEITEESLDKWDANILWDIKHVWNRVQKEVRKYGQ
jgi:hypothetical protein